LGKEGKRCHLTNKRSKTRDKIGVAEIGLTSEKEVGGLILGIGVIIQCFQESGEMPVVRIKLY
jgi:hypothetical protein